MKFRPNSQSGFSLVTVLLVMGIVLVAMWLITQAKFRAQGTQKAIKIKQSYADVNQALINGIVDTFHKNISASCGNLVQTKLNGWSSLDGSVDYRFERNVKVATPKDNSKANMVPVIHKEAQARCRSPKSPGAGQNRFYFCVELRGDANAPKDSILNAEAAFAEFAVELIDLQTQKEIDCAAYASRRDDINPTTGLSRDGSAGMAVTMALYWANRTGARDDSFTYSQKALSYIANQN